MVPGSALNLPYRPHLALLPYGSRTEGMADYTVPVVPQPLALNGWANVPLTDAGYRAGLGRLQPIGSIGPHYLRDYLPPLERA